MSLKFIFYENWEKNFDHNTRKIKHLHILKEVIKSYNTTVKSITTYAEIDATVFNGQFVMQIGSTSAHMSSIRSEIINMLKNINTRIESYQKFYSDLLKMGSILIKLFNTLDIIGNQILKANSKNLEKIIENKSKQLETKGPVVVKSFTIPMIP